MDLAHSGDTVPPVPKLRKSEDMVWKAAEQLVGHKDSQENGTCAPLIPLHNATAEDLDTDELIRQAEGSAPEVTLDDLEHTEAEASIFHQCLVHCIMRIAVQYGRAGLGRLAGEVSACSPTTESKIEVYTTEFHPLPAMNIDESSTIGNADVIMEVLQELHIDTSSPSFYGSAKLIAGNQLSLVRDRALEVARAGNEGSAEALRWACWVPGLFHYKMAATNGMMLTHLGLSNHDLSNPASLAAHNAVLERKHITVSSLPPFRKPSLEKLADGVTLRELKRYAEAVVSAYANSQTVEDLRDARDENLCPPFHGTKAARGDMVFENAILFLRDALILREFTDAVKAGDSGRVLLVLKIWVFIYRGAVRAKYAYETLNLIHNLQRVCPKRLKRVIMNNWLVNPTGVPNAFVEVDLLQEHLNYWVKIFCRAHGSNASWEWLEVVAPCVNVLRKLSNKINAALGSKQGNHHAAADLSADITT
ncbi:hypothetical protein CONPUDRAFT_160399 [Coniophora puteana RWD-64-598 SS2]|uniref:DUF6589 domain-containing protein n=1 Tax=Coniophora puteana (strain RWD-64-598) TaxID=741705 RepID=R7SDA8_CONPW|nr:uncharacterized protein CONPUDRAFT_160399 [Coniophora puteana RWD-64-598 SS2]EIW74151.1 hypothetical protein CONPUDRAFT_160399 [Coniophora puteana RWD-64-598 SS2]